MKGGYVDGFVFPVPKKNIGAYKKMASDAAKVWKKFGALEYYECVGEDLAVKKTPGMPKTRDFRAIARSKGGDTTWFSFIVYKNRAHRDAVNKKVMAFFEKKYADKKDMSMPFDVKKMAYGGFKAVVRS
jgi:alkaline phosphatase